jgi:ABC-type transport system involved in multi-copper enzyme maturation permease subunit
VTHAGILARNTFRESVRDRVLVAVLSFGALFVVSAVVLAPLTLGEQERVIRDLGLAAISLFTVLLIVLLGTAMVYREVERRTIQTILTHPVSRPAFILGKFLGFYATVLVSLAMLSAVYLLVVALFGGGVHAWLLATLGLAALEAMIVTAVAILFSTIASPLLSAVFTFLVFVAGHLAQDVKRLTEVSDNPGLHAVASAFGAVLPALHLFDARNNLLSGIAVPPSQLAGCAAYAVLYTAAVLAVTVLAFSRRDFE